MSTSTSQPKQVRLSSAKWPHANEFMDLLRIAADAANIQPPFYLESLLGPVSSWIQTPRKYSEFTIVDLWKPVQTLRYFRDTTIPASPSSAPDWAETVMPSVLRDLFWRPSRFFQQSDVYGSPCSFPDEHWFFVNGVASNEDVARLNAEYLAQLFHRPVTVLQNATDSLIVDLIECAVGKGFKKDPSSDDRKTMTEPAWKATAAILEALNAPATKKVVVIAHSQGTIIVANVLRAIAKALREQRLLASGGRRLGWHDYTQALMGGIKTDTDKTLRDELAHSLSVFGTGKPEAVLDRVQKLEIYTFANCADKMTYVAHRGGKAFPYLEHFANEYDIVARLGILSPNDKIDIDGVTYVQRDGWGHLLNEHHLFAIDDYLYPGPDHVRDENPFRPTDSAFGEEPRLYGYFHGKRPIVH